MASHKPDGEESKAAATEAALRHLKEEIQNELRTNDNVSLQIWKMFNDRNTILPNNKRILNLSWRLNSIDKVKNRSKPFISSPSSVSSPAYRVTKQQPQARKMSTKTDPTNADFDYIEHIRKISREEFTPYRGTGSVPITIAEKEPASSNDHYSPETNSLASTSNSVFSQFMPNAHQARQPSFVLDSQGDNFNIDSFVNFDSASSQQPQQSFTDPGFNEFDILDFSKFEDTTSPMEPSTATPNPNTNMHLSNYINSLEISVKEDTSKVRLGKRAFSNSQSLYPLQQQSLSTAASASKFHQQFDATSPSAAKVPKNSSQQTACENCFTTTTPLWRKTNDNKLLCNACGLFFKLHGVIRPLLNVNNGIDPGNDNRPVKMATVPSVSTSPNPSSSPNARKRSFEVSPRSDFEVPSAPPMSRRASTQSVRRKSTVNGKIVKPKAPVALDVSKLDDPQMGETLSGDWDWLKFSL